MAKYRVSYILPDGQSKTIKVEAENETKAIERARHYAATKGFHYIQVRNVTR